MRHEKYIAERARKSGISFVVAIPYYDTTGKRVQFSRSFPAADYPTKAAALKAAKQCRDEMLHKLNTSVIPSRSSKTVAEVFEISLQSRNLRPETERQHRITFESNVPASLAQMPVRKLKAIDVKLNLAEAAKIRTNGTMRRLLTMWRQICEAAIDAELIDKDFMRGVKAPKSAVISTKRQKTMQYSLDAVLDAIAAYGRNNDQERFNREIMINALALCAALGLRPAEVFAIRKEDVDLMKREIRVGYRVGTGERRSAGELIGPKTETSLRTIPLTDAAIEIICKTIATQDSTFLFARWDGSLWSSLTRSGYIFRACQKAGIEFTAYQLRHQFSTDLITSGTDLRTVQELMGHASGSMSLEYARSNDELKREALKKLQKDPDVTA